MVRLRKTQKVPMARVIVDSRDAKKDYFITKLEAARLYNDMKLGWDETNECYCVLDCKTRSYKPRHLLR